MSEPQTDVRSQSFFDLYIAGQADADAIGDWIGRWHAGHDADGRKLHEYLGMSLPEYQVWVYDPDSLPCLRDARHSGRALREAVAAHLASLSAGGGVADPAVLHGLRIWLDAAPREHRPAA